MNADRRALTRIALLAALPWAVFASCAEGSKIEGNTTSTTGPGGSGGGGGPDIPPGQIGGVCETQEDCVEGTCTQVGDQKFCTVACPPTCPAKTYCAIIDGDSICVPDLGQQCLVCNIDSNCASPSDACLSAPLGDKFCAIDCTTLGWCPNGFTCMVRDEYEGGGGGAAGSGGAGGAAGAGGAGGATSGGDPMGVPYKFCVPNSGQSCLCDEKRDGVVHACIHENEFGECRGIETCNGDAGAWEGCNAATPAAETCNGQDDDCDDQVDVADPEELCGPLPPHATWACNGGSCELGPCEPGWSAYPPGPPSAGCTCQTEVVEPNDACAAAVNVGVVSDAGGSLAFSGTISSATDVDFWTFDAVDTAQGGTDTYHVSVDFTAPMPNDELVVDVIRGATCVDAPSGAGTAITSYDWCVDGTSADGTAGEGSCGPTAAVHCTDNSSKYFVRVYRKAGATGTCAQYTVTVTATGGDACDFTQVCQ